MKKIAKAHANGKRRTVAVVAVAALLVAMLSITAGAAYAFGWFTADPVVGDHALSYPTDVETPATSIPYTEEELARKEAGFLQTFEDAEIEETGAVATTDNYRYTLEEMVATEHALQAIMRVDALNEEAKAAMQEVDFYGFCLNISNHGGGSRFFDELKSGGMGCRALSFEESTGYFLLTNNGGRNEEGDQIQFSALHDSSFLFIVPLEEVVKDKVVVPMDASVYEGKPQQFETMTVTPLSIKLEGKRLADGIQQQELSVTLKDGSSFAWEGHENTSDYGTPGFLSNSGGGARDWQDPYRYECWMFSQAIDLGDIDHITVDGVDYTLN
ncbi:MAG: hypothetical protein E7464_08120 [Ruminococcaceae bacterium]|nr:hypothetical protein [Oscillospiraceae bacterium]